MTEDANPTAGPRMITSENTSSYSLIANSGVEYCDGVLCLSGDIVIDDDDGAVVVPADRAHQLAAAGTDHEQWESFARMRIDQGARLSDYYPLSAQSRREFEAWRDDR